VIRNEGKINIQGLYISRIKRLTPAYISSICLVILIAFASRNFQLWEKPDVLVNKILSWFAFGLLGAPNINQVPNTFIINSGVIWTLAYEWKFYLALPFIGIAWRGYAFIIMLMLMYTYGIFIDSIGFIRFFAYGIATAYFLNKFDMKNLFRSNIFSVIAMLLLSSVFFIQESYGHFFIFLFFLIIVGGNSLFSLFTNAPAKLLGTISYSVYLFHGIVIFIVMHGLNRFLPVAGLNEIHFWMVTAMCGLLTVILSCITYRYIEHPFLRK
jgi:peptidoglycan/LPS O-acetylase OafA/YrhL